MVSYYRKNRQVENVTRVLLYVHYIQLTMCALFGINKLSANFKELSIDIVP